MPDHVSKPVQARAPSEVKMSTGTEAGKPAPTASELADEMHGLILTLQAERVALHQGFIPEHTLDMQIGLAEKVEASLRSLAAEPEWEQGGLKGLRTKADIAKTGYKWQENVCGNCQRVWRANS